jgi:formylglycine-generating enzyme required for sulfatase activity
MPHEFPAPWASDWGEDMHYGLWMSVQYRGVRQQLRWIPPGTFRMGSPPGEAERSNDEIQHEVTLTQGFWLADTACTQALWQAVMGSNPSRFTGAERPVERVNWEEVQGFLERLNAALADDAFRLPTEAEWEYACRAGTTTPFWFGAQITPAQVNYDGNYPYAGGRRGVYRAETVPVTALPCNGWGLYQMHGNVWEWCQDWYGTYPSRPVTDPVGPAAGENRVLRGGSWFNYGRSVRSAVRFAFHPGSRSDDIGFRLARGQGPGR